MSTLDDKLDACLAEWLRPVRELCERLLAEHYGVSEETVRTWFGGGGGFGGYWYCTGCGNPQLGDPPWRELKVENRCRPCGPGKGWVSCPATHEKAGCNLCRGRGWVEEI